MGCWANGMKAPRRIEDTSSFAWRSSSRRLVSFVRLQRNSWSEIRWMAWARTCSALRLRYIVTPSIPVIVAAKSEVVSHDQDQASKKGFWARIRTKIRAKGSQTRRPISSVRLAARRTSSRPSR